MGEDLWGGSEDVGYAVQQTNDGGYIIVGSTQSYGAGKSDVYLVKTDPKGDQLWHNTFGGTNYDGGYSVQQTNDGGYIIVGSTQSYGAGKSDVYLVKTDPNGNHLWDSTFGGTNYDGGYSVQQTNDGGYIIAGWRSRYVGSIPPYTPGELKVDCYLVKTDPNGNLLWDKIFSRGSSGGHSVDQTSDGGYVIVGSTKSYGTEKDDVYLIKTDPNGSLLWDNAFGGISEDKGTSVQQTSDGGYVIAGSTDFSGGGIYLIKTDSDGYLLWEKTFGGDSEDVGYSVQQTNDGGYVIVGEKKSYGAGWIDAYLIKTDPNGNRLWDETFGGSSRDIGHSVQQTTDGAYIVAGTSYSSGAGEGDVYLIKTHYQVFTPNLEQGFEAGGFSPLAWVHQGTAWQVTAADAFAGNYSAQSGVVEDGESSTLSLTCEFAAREIHFAVKVSSEEKYDKLTFLIDDQEITHWSGEVAWTEVNYPLTVGLHTLSWSYEKDESKSVGQDAAWIDVVVFTQSENLNGP